MKKIVRMLCAMILGLLACGVRAQSEDFKQGAGALENQPIQTDGVKLACASMGIAYRNQYVLTNAVVLNPHPVFQGNIDACFKNGLGLDVWQSANDENDWEVRDMEVKYGFNYKLALAFYNLSKLGKLGGLDLLDIFIEISPEKGWRTRVGEFTPFAKAEVIRNMNHTIPGAFVPRLGLYHDLAFGNFHFRQMVDAAHFPSLLGSRPEIVTQVQSMAWYDVNKKITVGAWAKRITPQHNLPAQTVYEINMQWKFR
jgi:hypothetical protein